MFKLFKRKEVLTNPLQEKVANGIVMKILRWQEKWAGFMDGCVNSRSVRSKKIGLIVFVGLSILICVSIVIETIRKPAVFKVHSIVLRKNLTSTGEVKPPVTALMPEREYKKILAFHHYMDSIAVSDHRLFDSINHCRPGLMDSIITLEKLYHSQNK